MTERKYINTDFGPIPLSTDPAPLSERILKAKREALAAWARGDQHIPAE